MSALTRPPAEQVRGLRVQASQLFHKYGVDLAIYGHVHDYGGSAWHLACTPCETWAMP